jgi:hypothetical protein
MEALALQPAEAGDLSEFIALSLLVHCAEPLALRLVVRGSSVAGPDCTAGRGCASGE